MATPSALLDVRSLVKKMSGRRILDGVDLRVSAGEVYGLVGPNGAGKTTLLRCIVGFSRPDAGSVLVRGLDVTARPSDARAGIGALIDRPGFYPFLSGRENLRELALMHGERPSRVLLGEALERVGLEANADRRYRTYSKGMAQRLALAAALLFRPAVVILDEPSDGLDPRGIKDVRKLVSALRTEGSAVLLCTHDLHQVAAVADTLGLLHQGRLLAEGSPSEVASLASAADGEPGDDALECAVLDLLGRADAAGR